VKIAERDSAYFFPGMPVDLLALQGCGEALGNSVVIGIAHCSLWWFDTHLLVPLAKRQTGVLAARCE